MPDDNSHQLVISNLCTGYGKKQVLNGVSASVGRGEIVAIIGHNGAGKSTLLRTIFGLLPIWSGSIAVEGVELRYLANHQLRRVGVSFVPQGNRVFTELSVRDNLKLANIGFREDKSDEHLNAVLEIFPLLRRDFNHNAGTLSGGERQMLSLAMALEISPRFLLLDEPSLGLAPNLVRGMFSKLQALNTETGASFLIVEQKVREILGIANRVYVLRNGTVSYSGSASILKDDEDLLRQVYL